MRQSRPLVLASASPRRRELLATLGLRFEVRPCDVDESVRPGEASRDYVRRLAEEKLRAALAIEVEKTPSPISQAALPDGAQLAERAQAHGWGPRRGFTPRGEGAGDSPSEEDAFVLASDTTVIVDDAILGKPENDAEGRALLTRLSDRAHEVRTAIALGRSVDVIEVRDVVTRVVFRALGADEIARYVATGEGRDKAGGYGIQGLAGAFVTRIEGSYSNVVGLPLAETLDLLVAHGAVEAWP